MRKQGDYKLAKWPLPEWAEDQCQWDSTRQSKCSLSKSALHNTRVSKADTCLESMLPTLEPNNPRNDYNGSGHCLTDEVCLFNFYRLEAFNLDLQDGSVTKVNLQSSTRSKY